MIVSDLVYLIPLFDMLSCFTFMKKCMQTFKNACNIGYQLYSSNIWSQSKRSCHIWSGSKYGSHIWSWADIIWHGGTEYGSHILSGRTKYGSYNWSRIKCGCCNRSTGQFLGRTVCAMTGYLRTTTNTQRYVIACCIVLIACWMKKIRE